MQIPLIDPKRLNSLLPRVQACKTSSVPECPGVYLWTFDNDSGETLFYVGRARNIKHRVAVHMDLMFGTRENIGTSKKHTRAALKYRDTAKLFILETLPESPGKKDTLASLERFWILYFWKMFGAKRLLNVEVVPDSAKFTAEHSARMSKVHRLRFASDPNARKFMADKVKEQWKDPEFQSANKKRLQDLRSTGWSPGAIVLYKVKLPNGNKYTVPRKEFAKYLGIGCRPNGFLSFFTESRLLSDWKVSEYARVSGKERQSAQNGINANWQAFLEDPFITWFSHLRDRLPQKAHWARGSPCKFLAGDSEKKTFFTTSFRKGGKVLVPDGKYISAYETLYQFARDRLPIHF
jgi:hypothetical protein